MRHEQRCGELRVCVWKAVFMEKAGDWEGCYQVGPLLVCPLFVGMGRASLRSRQAKERTPEVGGAEVLE